MKITINNEQTKNKTLEYEEGFWTGKRTIKYDGVILKKIKRGLYEYKNGDVVEQFEVKGNQIYGVKMKMFGEVVELARQITWYEICLGILVFVPCILFGAIGGAIGGALGFTNLTIIKKIENIWLKILVSVEFAAVSLLASYVFVCLVFKAANLIGI